MGLGGGVTNPDSHLWMEPDRALWHGS
jgi:hypothetical protein